MHFNSGIDMALSKLCTGSVVQDAGPSKHMALCVLSSLHRIELLSTLFDNNPNWSYPMELHEVVPDTFESVGDTRDSMIHIMNITMRFLRRIERRKWEGRLTDSDCCTRAELQQAHRK